MAVERQRELDRTVVVEVRDRDTDEGQPALFDQRRDGGEERSRRREDRLGVRGGAGQRVRAGGPGEVVEAKAQDDGSTHSFRLAHAAGHPVDERDDLGVDLVRRARPAAQRPL